MNAASILSSLTDKGFRLTAVRKTLVAVLAEASHPISAEDAIVALEAQGLKPNKTTVYRELEFLGEQGLVFEVDFAEGKKRYELSHHGHHHHLVCTECNSIEGIDIEESGLHTEEEKVLAERGFKVTRHMLEFFGLCRNCRGKAAK